MDDKPDWPSIFIESTYVAVQDRNQILFCRVFRVYQPHPQRKLSAMARQTR